MSYSIRDDYSAIAARLQAGGRALVTSHVEPDGDAIGSALAMAALVRAFGGEATVVMDGRPSEVFDFLLGGRDYALEREWEGGEFDVVYGLDCGARYRLERVYNKCVGSPPLVNIDHHTSNDRFGALNAVDDGASSTCEMLFEMIRQCDLPLTREMGECLYVGMVTDTGQFGYSSTTPTSHDLAKACMALGIVPADIARRVFRSKPLGRVQLEADLIGGMQSDRDGKLVWSWLTNDMLTARGVPYRETGLIIDLLKGIAGVQVAVLFRDAFDGTGKVKFSVRTEGAVDANALCAQFGGGGHERAAGATVEGARQDVEQQVLGALRERLATVLA